jgi:hypothetical protein
MAYASAGSLTNAGASYTMTSGTIGGIVKYNQAGDSNYNPAPEMTAAVAAAKASATLALTTADLAQIYTGASKTVAATTTPAGLTGVNVSYAQNNAPATPLNAGTYQVTATLTNDNYAAAAAAENLVIGQAAAVVTVNGYTGDYDGQPHGATGTAIGIGNTALTGLDLGATFTDAPGGTANWTFSNDNYLSHLGSTGIIINKADASATITLGNLSQTYTGGPLAATASTTAAGSSTFTFTYDGQPTPPTNAGSYTVVATLTNPNYVGSKTGTLVINKAVAVVSVSGYSGTYDATAHGATGTATGVAGENMAGSLALGSSYTDAPGGTASWSFTNPNYTTQSGSVAIAIGKANAAVSVTGYTGTYDAAAHGATGTATGVSGINLHAGLDLGATFTTVPGGTASWAFDGGINYNNQSGTVAIVINPATAAVMLANLSQTYTGAPLAVSASAPSATGSSTFTYAYSQNNTPVAAASVINAGTYQVTATLHNANFTGSATDDFVIAQAANVVSFAALSPQTYAPGATLALTASSPGGPVTFAVTSGPATVVGNTLTITGAGNVTVTASQAGSANYLAASDVAHTFTVAQATQTITFAALPNKTYTDADFVLSASSSSTLPVSFAVSGNATLLPDGHTVHLTGAGSVTVTASQAGNTNYLPATDVAHSFSIAKATATLAFGTSTFTYDGLSKSVTVSTVPAGLSGTAISYDGSAAAPTEAGSYTLAATLTDTNYEASPLSGSLTIDKGQQVIIWNNPAAITYGTALSATELNATVAGVAQGSAPGALTYMPAMGTVLSAGPHTLSVSAAATSNYFPATATVTLLVNQATLTVTADNASRTYGAANPAFTAHYSGYVNGDNASAFSGAPALTTPAIATSPVGSYTISAATGTLTAANYQFQFVNSILTVNQALLAATADNQSRTYGDTNPAFTGMLMGVQNGDAIGVTYSTTATSTSAIGTYAIIPALTDPGNKLGNYAVTLTNATLTVGTRALTVTADAKSKTYGDADPGLTYSITSGSLAGADSFVGALTRNSGESVGIYAITQGSLALSPNYALTYVGANLSIGQRPVTVAATTGQTKVYGTAEPTLTYGITAGNLVFGDVFMGNVNRLGGENVGTYAIGQGSLQLNGNYQLLFMPGTTFAITARPLTITADAKTKIYGDADPGLTYGITSGSLVAGDGFTGSLSRAAGENVGMYAITSSVSAGPNYDLTYVGANLSITPRAVAITAAAKTKMYGAVDPALTYAISSGNLVFSDAFSGALTRDMGEAVGDYAIRQGTVALSANYALTYTGANLSITPKAASVVVAAKTKVYGDADPIFTGILTGFLPADNVTAAYSRTGGETVLGGPYPISATLSGPLNNYAITNTPAALTITTKALAPAVVASSKVYDGNTAAVVTPQAFSTLVGTDAVTLAISPVAGHNTFDTRNVGTGKTVTATNLTLAGSAASNYALTTTTATALADITQLSVTGNFTADDKTYDGNTSATVLTRTLNGVVSGNAVSLNGGTATFANKNVGSGKTVTLTGAALTGSDAANYYLTSVATTTASISARALLVSATGVNKVYDATTTATVTLSDNRVSGDVLTTAYASANFADANIGSGKPVSVMGISISGIDAGNYTANSTANAAANITAAATALAVTGGTVQYSDRITFTATATASPSTAQAALNASGGTVIFKLKQGLTETPLGTSTAAEWNNGSVSKEFTILQAPGSYSVLAYFTPASSNFAGANTLNPATLAVTQEDADATYTGDSYYTLPTATTTSYSILLTATVKDITALPTSTPGYDANPGDVRNARVVFRKDSPVGAVLGTATVALVNAADPKVGIASVLYNGTLANADVSNGGLSLTVFAVVEGYYTDATDGTPVTISLPGANFVTGGGYLLNTASQGTIAGTAGAKTNFGFTMQYNKSGANLKGQCNIIIRSNGRVYQVKSNAINTLSVGATTATGATPAYFNTKANYTDITNPLLPISLGGNLDLTVWMTDVSQGGQNDMAAIQLLNGSQLLFASNWNGTQTAQQLLGGGNVQVRNTAAAARLTLVATDSSAIRISANATGNGPTAAPTAEARTGLLPTAGTTLLELYPLPITEQATVHFRTEKGGKAQVYLYNQLGVLVATLYNAEVQSGQEYYLTLRRENLATGVYFCRLISNGKVENRRFTIVQ